MRKCFTFCFLILPFLFPSCSSDKSTHDPDRVIVASVDDLEISETSFQRAFIPVLLYGDKFDSEEARLEILNVLIGQKLLAMEARKTKLDKEAYILDARKRAERKALTRRIYKEWVKDKIKIPSEQELLEGFNRGRKSVFVRHLFAESEAEIQEYAHRLKSEKESFYTLAQDVFEDSMLAANGGALGWITFGDLDEALEDTIYSLKPGQISQAVKSQFGWHLISVDDIQEDLVVSEQDFSDNRGIIYKKIIERRENLLGKNVINNFMSQLKISFNRDITKQVWPEVTIHLNSGSKRSMNSPEFFDTGGLLTELKDETLLTVNGEKWSVEEILKRLPEIDRTILHGNLYVAASNVIRDEMLSREAKQLDFLNDQDVIDEVTDSQEQLLANIYVGAHADTMVFSETRQKAFFSGRAQQRYHGPDSLEVQLFAFGDSLAATQALIKSRRTDRDIDLTADQFWIDKTDQGSSVYKLSRSIAIGTLAGPVQYKNSWVLVKLLKRHRTALEFKKIQKRVLADMEKDRFNAARGILLKDIRPKHEIVIHQDLLNNSR